MSGSARHAPAGDVSVVAGKAAALVAGAPAIGGDGAGNRVGVDRLRRVQSHEGGAGDVGAEDLVSLVGGPVPRLGVDDPAGGRLGRSRDDGMPDFVHKHVKHLLGGQRRFYG